MGKRIFALLDALVIIILFVGYLNDVKYAHDLLVLLNLINIPIILKFNKINKSEENRSMGKREVFLSLNIFAIILLIGFCFGGIKNLFVLFLILVGINICMFFCYSILSKKNIKN